MEKKEYKKLIGEFRQIAKLNFELREKNHENRLLFALINREREIMRELGFCPTIARSYITKTNCWDVLEFGHRWALVLGSRNRVKNNPTPSLP